jgi:hypothetical protein
MAGGALDQAVGQGIELVADLLAKRQTRVQHYPAELTRPKEQPDSDLQ